MSQSDIRKLLGYSPKDPMILSESDADDVVDAYKELVAMARDESTFEDLVDGIANFLDACGDMDPDGTIEKKFCMALRNACLSDDFKDQVKSILTMTGESRVYEGRRIIAESVEDLDAELTALNQSIRMSRDFNEVSSEISTFLGKLRDMNGQLGSSIENELVSGMADFMASMKKTILKKAKVEGGSDSVSESQTMSQRGRIAAVNNKISDLEAQIKKLEAQKKQSTGADKASVMRHLSDKIKTLNDAIKLNRKTKSEIEGE